MDKSDAGALWPLSKRTVRTLKYGSRCHIGNDFVVVDITPEAVKVMVALGGEKPGDLLAEFKRRTVQMRRKTKPPLKSLDNGQSFGTN